MRKYIDVKRFLSLLLIMGAIFMGITLCYIALPTKKSPEAVKGQLDLTHWNFQKDGIAFLNGNWSFYPQKMLEPEYIPSSGTCFLKVPGTWDNTKACAQPLKGNATYHLSVILPDRTENLMLKVQNIWTAHRLYINGSLVKEMGTPSLDDEHYKPNNTPYTISIAPTSKLDIVLEVSNQIFYNGGIPHPIQLGGVDAMENKSLLSFGIDMAGFFLFLLFGLYHLQMYQNRDKELIYLYSGIYLVLMSFVIITSGEKLFMRIFPDIPYQIAYRFQDFSIFSSFPLLLLFVRSLEPRIMNKKMLYAVIVPIVLYLFLVIGTPYTFYIEIKGFMAAYTDFLLFICFIRLIYIWLQKKGTKMPVNENYYAMASVIFILAVFVDAALYHTGYVYTNVVGKIALLGFLVSLNLLMAKRYTNKMTEAHALSQELIKITEIKDEFLARTSHELKTPLHGIINISSHLLEKEKSSFTEKQIENITLIQDTSMKLSLLINDLTDAIKLRHEDIQLQTVTVDLYVIVQIVFQLLSFDLERTEVRLVNRLRPLTFVEADENRLRQILFNIIGNAVKYTDKGEIIASAKHEDGDVLFSLSDTGSGISKEQWELVFQDSYRSLQSKGSNQGMGLGLYISRQLARKMKGEVWVSQSTVGQGTTFSVRLPKGNRQDSYKEYREEMEVIKNENKSFRPQVRNPNLKKILLVDDEPTNIRVLSLMLEEEFELYIAYQGEEALKLLQNHRMDLVILDVMMHGMSGIELTERIRQTYSVIDLPVIVATVRDSDKDIELAYRAGANDYITKPFTAEEIRSRVKILLQLTDAVETALKNQTAYLQAQIKPHFIYNALSNIIALCYEDGEMAAEMLTLLSRYLRHIFQADPSRHVLPLQTELDIIKTYVEIEKLRFGARLRYEANIDPIMLKDEIMIPALLIQPLIENAIRHGLFNKKGLGTLSLTVTEWEDFICIVVQDDGIGLSEDKLDSIIKSKEGTGIGIKNIRKRVESIPQASFLMDSVLEKGTKCTLLLPKDAKKYA